MTSPSAGNSVDFRPTVLTMQVMLFFIVVTLCLHFTYSVKIERSEPRCPSGSFRNAAIGRCQVCTQPCPSPLTEIRACRHDADTICGAPDADAADDVTLVHNKPRSIKSCSANSFFNRETGLCQECIRFCDPPLVMTKACRRHSDAVCGRPRSASGKAFSRRRKKKHERKRKRKTGKRLKPKQRPSHPHEATPDQLCSENGEQFYDLAQGRCLPCRNCDGALEEISPCTSTSDRVCRAKHGTNDPRIPHTVSSAAVLQSNELPKDGHRGSEMSNRSRNNEYPDSRAGTGSRKHPGKTDNVRDNSAENQDPAVLDSIHSNIAE